MSKISIKLFFDNGEVDSIETILVPEDQNIYDVACKVAYDLVGYTLVDWQLLSKSYNKNNKIASELYHFYNNDEDKERGIIGSYFQLKFDKGI